jgi:hypothetical protein
MGYLGLSTTSQLSGLAVGGFLRVSPTSQLSGLSVGREGVLRVVLTGQRSRGAGGFPSLSRSRLDETVVSRGCRTRLSWPAILSVLSGSGQDPFGKCGVCRSSLVIPGGSLPSLVFRRGMTRPSWRDSCQSGPGPASCSCDGRPCFPSSA